MGFFKSLNQLNKQAKEIDKAAGPMDQRLGAAMAQMQQAQQFMAQQTGAADPAAVMGQAQVLAVRDTGARINMNPSVQLDLLVTLPGQPPYPVSTGMVLSVGDVGRLTAGAIVPVRVNPATPEQVHLA